MFGRALGQITDDVADKQQQGASAGAFVVPSESELEAMIESTVVEMLA